MMARSQKIILFPNLNKRIFVLGCQLFTIGTITNRMPSNLCSVIKLKTPPTKCKCLCLHSNALHSSMRWLRDKESERERMGDKLCVWASKHARTHANETHTNLLRAYFCMLYVFSYCLQVNYLRFNISAFKTNCAYAHHWKDVDLFDKQN